MATFYEGETCKKYNHVHIIYNCTQRLFYASDIKLGETRVVIAIKSRPGLPIIDACFCRLMPTNVSVCVGYVHMSN